MAKRCQSPMLTSQHTLMAALGLARRQHRGTEPSPPSPRSAQRGVCAGSHGKAGCVLTFLWGQGLWCQEAAPSHSLCAWARCKEAAAPRGSQVEQQCYSISGTEGAQQTRTSPAAELWKQHVMLQCALQSTAQPSRPDRPDRILHGRQQQGSNTHNRAQGRPGQHSPAKPTLPKVKRGRFGSAAPLQARLQGAPAPVQLMEMTGTQNLCPQPVRGCHHIGSAPVPAYLGTAAGRQGAGQLQLRGGRRLARPP